jgi:hypothetical protein
VTLQTWHFASRGETCLTASPLAATFDADAWAHPDLQLLDVDRRVHALEDEVGAPFALELAGKSAHVSTMHAQFPLRYQRLFARRNDASRQERFDRLLALHARLHDRQKPLVRADHDHALDVWQWTLRLAPDASEALQIAALFHDIERLSSEADVRIEQHAGDYLAFKLRHAKKGAVLLAAVLDELALPDSTRARACALVERHEQPERDSELATLNDADALSWFALNSPGFLAYFGAEHTRKKLEFTLARMRSQAARELLSQVRLQREVAAMLHDAGWRSGARSRSRSRAPHA